MQSGNATPLSRRISLTGRVQGVGFRPFVYRLAHELGLTGWVRNRTGVVEILVQGEERQLERFASELIDAAPPLAQPHLLETQYCAAPAYPHFEILPSAEAEQPQIHLPPDYFTCDACLAELDDPQNRRYRYPFINCTQCGPRYTLIRALPYDRSRTTMARFPLCPSCQAEYEAPSDRRYHAEPIACPRCGPTLSWRSGESIIDDSERALIEAQRALLAGEIVAVKGIGGYHLLCDARNGAAVRRLRARKRRPDKPLALLFPLVGEDGLDAVRADLQLEPDSAVPLRSPARPIVLLRKRQRSDAGAGRALAEEIAPALDEIGAMLPYSPLHYLLAQEFAGPLVATSGNRSGEPVLTECDQAERHLATIADHFLHHNRPIQRPADDSVVRMIAGAVRPLRLGRGLAPLERRLTQPVARPTLAVGGHMKNSIALAWEDRVVLSPHIGDLDTPRSMAVFARLIEDLQALYRVRVERVIHDRHHGYASSRWARESGLECVAVLHHHAHASALFGEHCRLAAEERERDQPRPTERATPPWLVFTWDGVGLGDNNELWGGEALLGRPGAWKRVGSLLPFRLPGGERAGREPWRSAAALCWEAGIDYRPEADRGGLARRAWESALNTPRTSAAGRLFDAASALLELGTHVSFEGQGPMQLEALAAAVADSDLAGNDEPLPLLRHEGLWLIDWRPLLPLLLNDAAPAATRALALHRTLATTIAALTDRVSAEQGEVAVGLTGGVFQNALLARLVRERLARDGRHIKLAGQIPSNDGGLAFGQIIEQMG